MHTHQAIPQAIMGGVDFGAVPRDALKNLVITKLLRGEGGGDANRVDG